MHALGERFRQTIGQRLQEDGRIIVVHRFEARHVVVDTYACGDGKPTDPVFHAAVARRHEVGETEIRALHRLVGLLAEVVQGGDGLALAGPGGGIHFDVVAVLCRRPETDHAAGGQPLLSHQGVEHGLRVGIELARLGADHLVGEDGRELARQLPRIEKRRPVDIAAEFREVVIVEDRDAGLARYRWPIGLPVAAEALLARLGQRHQLLARAAIAMTLAHFGVLGANLRHELVHEVLVVAVDDVAA